MNAFDLPSVWAALIAAAVLFYVVFDGFDLGIGALFLLRKREAERDQMMNTIAPFWDGNETWLVLGGGGLWVAFPKAFAALMPAMYLPMLVMLLALVFRGVAFEFRWVAKPHHRVWDRAFAGGSVVAAFAQGVIMGGLVQGVTLVDGRFAGGAFDWLTPFSLMCGAGLVAGYTLLGACWLTLRADGDLETWSRHAARRALIVVLVFLAVVSVWTPLAIPRVAARWFDGAHLAYLWPVPVMTALLGFNVASGLRRGASFGPFLNSIGLFVLGFAGLAISTLPLLVPPTLTLWDAAAAPQSQRFSLIGVLIMLPIILGYFVFVYWTFRGKVKVGEGYH